MEKKQGIGFFEKYLTIWVALCIIIGIAVGQWLPAIPQILSKFEYANVSIPVAILIWLMIYPMMLKVDFQSVKNVGKRPKGIIVTGVTNWLIKPFTMFGIAYLLFYVVFKAFIPAGLAEEYLAGAVLLGAAPCTAMVFVWSYLTKGDAAYTLVQVAVNDLIVFGSVCPYRCFLAGSWRRIYPMGHSVAIRRALYCDTTCGWGHYPNNGYPPQRCGVFQQCIY